MKHVRPFFILAVLVLSLHRLAQGGGWGSAGAPPPPPIPPVYDYAYSCFVELSDEKRHEEKDSAHYLVATARFEFSKRGSETKKYVSGSELDWRMQKFVFPDLKYSGPIGGEIPFSHLLHDFYLVVDARSSSRGGSAAEDRVMFSVQLAQELDNGKVARYRKAIESTRADAWLTNEVRSDIGDRERTSSESLMLRVRCEKTF